MNKSKKPLVLSGFCVKVAFVKGFEPLACGLGNRRSILLSYTNTKDILGLLAPHFS